MTYRVEFTSGARRQLNALDNGIKKRILASLQKLARDPFAGNNDVKKLSGSSSYRLRVGDYRVKYELSTKALKITVIAAAHRRDVYR